MEEIGKALKSIFDKLSDFFDIFDLSFFVSGVALTVSVLFWLNQRELYAFQEIQFKGVIIVYILICYINGLVAFASGRWIRMGVWAHFKSKSKRTEKKYHPDTPLNNRYDLFDAEFRRKIYAHGLETNHIVAEYLDRKNCRGTWRLYVRLWAVIRDNKKYANSLSLIKRYWVMAATYDGLSIFLLVAILIVADFGFGIFGNSVIAPCWLVYPIILIMILTFFACIREAERYVDYQVEEVIATFAAGEN